MNSWRMIGVTFSLCCLLVASAFPLHGNADETKPSSTKADRGRIISDCLVVGVTDGDTVKARCGQLGDYEQIKVRLSAIDAPERKQAFGNRAKEALSDISFGKQADLICKNNDRYGRHVCKVMVAPASAPNGPKTLDSGLAMISVGMAWWYKAYSREQSPEERGQYEFAEIEAKSKRAGLWIDPSPTPPWEWRRAEKSTRSH